MKLQISKKNFKKTEIIFSVSFLVTTVSTLICLFLKKEDLKNILLTFFVLLPIFASLIYLAYYDFKKMEVHPTLSLLLIIVLGIANILLFIFKKDNGLGYDNLLGAITLGVVFQLIVLLTKEKGLGQGDVRIAIISGVLVGFSNLIPWLYITVFSSLIYGIGLTIKKKKFKGLKIPFVPFMVLGIIVTVLMGL